MTASRDPDRLIHDFLLEGEERLQDQVYDAVRAEIEQKRQRAVVGPWRFPPMNKFLAFGLGAAAVVVALLVGVQLFGSVDGGVGAEPTATATPAATPEPTPSQSAVANQLVIADGQAEDPQDAYPALTVTAPAGWGISNPTGVLASHNTDPPDGAFVMTFATREYWVYGDPCQWSSTRPDTPATTVDEVVAALTAQASRDATEPVDITVDGYAGKSFTLHVPDDAAFDECDAGNFGYWSSIDPEFGDDGVSPSRHAQAPGQVDTLYVLDLDGVVMIIDTSSYAGTSAKDVAALEAIVQSGTFGD
jgi:hypothetical protein